MFRRKHLSAGRQRSDNVRLFWRVAIVLFLSAITPTALSNPRSGNDASTVVAQWLRLDGAPLNARMGSRIGKVVPLKDSAGDVFGYAVYLKPTGFAIVPAEDDVEPVIAFSTGAEFKLSDDNPLGAMVLRDAAGRVRMARLEPETVAPGKARIRSTHAAKARSKWDLLRKRMPLLSATASRDEAIVLMGSASISDVRVAPFVLSKWDQLQEGGQNCYNYYTPNNWYCGCIATAMAQWMRYFQRPTFGVGTASSYIYINGSLANRNLRGGDGDGGPYSWADMPLDPDGTITPTQRAAIGALCHDAGVAAHMQYSSGGAGAFSADALIALTSTFGFSSGVYGHDGDRDLSGVNLNTMMNPNLHAKMPVMLGILRSSGGNIYGHAVLADGYGYQIGTLYHHLNMGWGGYGDAWYNLPTINPDRVYTSVFDCVYNVYTSGVGEIVSGRITDSGGSAITGVVITAVNETGAVFTAVSDARGIYAVVNLPPSERYWISPSRTGYAFTNLPADVGKSWSGTPLCGNVWGKDFIGIAVTGPANPRSFAAWVKSASQVDLQWKKNSSNDNVLVAWGTTGAFGAPSGAYLPGNPVGGGGTVLYVGSDTTQSHAGLTSGTAYHYRAWSVDANTNYSAGSQLAVTTHTIYYVNDASTDGDVWCSAAGNDANSGANSNAPKATMQAVLDMYDLEPGDSVYVDTGSYVLLSNIVVGAGDQGSPQHHVTIRGSPNGAVIDRNCGTNGAYGLYLNQADYMDLLDLSITGGYHSVFMYDADVCVVSNLTVRGATNCGVYMAYSWYNLFENLRVSGCKSDGIFTWYSTRNKFSRGIVCNNNYNGLELRYSASNLVENCTIAFNTCDQIYLTGAETVLFLTNSIVVASGSGKYGINWDSGSYLGDYNNLYATNGASVGYYGGPRTAMSNWRTATSRDTNSISADPMFVDAVNGDFHLKSTIGSYHGGAWTADTTNSPGIDTGLPTTSCALEPTPNGGFVNLGAYGNTPQASKSADADSDGLSDTFERLRGGSNPFVADSDGDGVNDGGEWAAGTSPTNSASVFAIEQVAQPEPSLAEIRWYSVANRFYAIDRATNLMNGGFTAVTNDIPATPPVNVYTDVVDGLGHTLFYRVKTQP